MCKLSDIKKVAGDSRYELSRLILAVIRIRQTLALLVQIATHVCFDFGTHHMSGVLHVVVRDNINASKYYINHSNPDDQAGRK